MQAGKASIQTLCKVEKTLSALPAHREDPGNSANLRPNRLGTAHSPRQCGEPVRNRCSGQAPFLRHANGPRTGIRPAVVAPAAICVRVSQSRSGRHRRPSPPTAAVLVLRAPTTDRPSPGDVPNSLIAPGLPTLSRSQSTKNRITHFPIRALVQSRCKSRNAASAPHAPGCTGHGRRMARPVTNEPPLCALDQDGSVHDPRAASMVTKCFI